MNEVAASGRGDTGGPVDDGETARGGHKVFVEGLTQALPVMD